MKRDRLWEIVIGLVLGNLAWMCVKLINTLFAYPRSFYIWGLLAANIVAIVGVFWLFRDYKRRLRAAKKEKEDAKVSE